MCQRPISVDPRGTIRWHKDPTGASTGVYCDGYGQPADGARAAEMERLAELVFQYPARARDLVAQLPE